MEMLFNVIKIEEFLSCEVAKKICGSDKILLTFIPLCAPGSVSVLPTLVYV